MVTEQGGDTRLVWQPATQGHVANVYRGVRATGSPWSYDTTCVVAETPELAALDTAVPVSGDLIFFLVGARNSCGDGRIGVDRQGVDLLASAPCAPLGNDTDGDGVPDVADNCPRDANADQADADQGLHRRRLRLTRSLST